MKIKKAEKLFHGIEGYNCAQAIFKTFQDEFNIHDKLILDAKMNGGGRAEQGLCGALYAAQQIIPDIKFIATINNNFIQNGGSLYCKEIKKNKKLPCRECVKLAAQCIQKQLEI